ncbi:glycosyltransferase family 2 protein [Nocardioides xinjiangensis]|uniref:glycosyltransferase family 2 protein n=1 Tax=Nocardioides xinjiangensis TaxID=2817376 RepID=UPI001B307DF2|nr:glycosyltransferase family 2 protein [Nocardioides sp. SYSU D00778]
MVTVVGAPAGLVRDTDGADVVVAVVTYNSSRVIGALLAALPAALASVRRCLVVVADNDSADGTPDLVRASAPWVRVINAGHNAGYAGGINLALRRYPAARAAYVLNPDAVPSPGSVSTLLDVVSRDPSIGIAVPLMLASDGTLCWSLRREPSVPRALGEALLGGRRAGRVALLGETVRDATRYRDGAVADWATGAAMMVTRAAINAVGEWDERFFLYSEETDYCLRVRDAGYRLQLVEAAQVVHQGGDQATSADLWALAAVNRTRLYRKRHSRPASAAYWAAVLLNEAMRARAGESRHRTAVRALLGAGPDQRSARATPAILSGSTLEGGARPSPASGPPGVGT